jgi:ribosome-associated protein
MIEVIPGIKLHEGELEFRFVRASGPGGQNVNKVATAAELRFDVMHSKALPEPMRSRLLKLAGWRVNSGGVLIIFAQRFRSQERNRADALERLQILLRRAARAPQPRKSTRPTAAAKRRRLEGKRRRSFQKRLRTRPDAE